MQLPDALALLFAQALDPDALPGGEALLEWLLAPAPVDAFMDAVFDSRPLLVSRPDSPCYYAPWFSRAVIDDLLRHALPENLRLLIGFIVHAPRGTWPLTGLPCVTPQYAYGCAQRAQLLCERPQDEGLRLHVQRRRDLLLGWRTEHPQRQC